jgi:outer membrane protein OmpA-like peptidoglycan-associated protein
MADAMQSPVSSAADKVVGITKWRRIRKILWWILGLVTAFALIGFLAVPPIVKPILEEDLSKALQREVTVETLRVNPFAPSATVRGFVMRERSGDAPFVTFDELYLNAGWSSIIRLAPVVDEAKLTKAHVRVIRNPDRTYNFQDLIDRFLARPKGKPPPKFAAYNLRIVEGRIDVDDRAEDEKHDIADLRIGIPFISSLPSQVDVTVVPELSARVNGALVGMKGEMLPFKDTHVATLNVDLDKFDLTRLVDYLPFELSARVKSALLNTRLVVAFEQRKGNAPRIEVRGAAAVTQLNVHDPQDRPMVACQRIAVEINEVDALAPAVNLESVAIEAPDVHVRRDKSGAINLERLGLAAAEGDQMQREARRKTGKAAVPVKFGSLLVKSGRVRFTDEKTDPAFEGAIEEVQIEARDFDNTIKDRRNDIAIQARTEAGESFKLDVATTADPRSAEGRLEVARLRLKDFQPYVNQASNLEVDDGRFDIGFAFRWASDLAYEKHELTISDLALALKGFRARLRGEKDLLFRVASIEVNGAGGQLRSQTANLGTITVREAAISLRREKDGKLNLQRIPRDSAAGTPPPAAKPAEMPVATPATPWRLDLGALSLERSSVALEDLAVGAPVKVSISPLQLKAQNLSTAKGQRGNVDLRATIEKRGTIAASGPFSIEPLAGSLQIDARTIDFALAQRYIDDRVKFRITSGAVSAKGATVFERAPGGAMKVSYKGDVSVTDLASVDKPKNQDLLKWKSLSAAAVDFDLEPFKLNLGEIALAGFYGRVILSAEGRLNMQDLMQPPEAAAAGKPPAAKPVTPALKPKRGAAPAAASPPDIRLGEIMLRGGSVDFSDFFVKPNFSGKLSDIHGSLTEMTPDKPSEVELRAKGQRAALVEILGRVNPLAPSLFLDIQGTAKGIELPPISAYSMKYVGYKIAHGKLTLNVKYHVENDKLVAENNIILDQLTFGEKVESPNATNLPVQAAVAILKDRNGVIDVNVPISGSLDDPKFSVTEAAIQAVGNLITKAVTAPFSVLGKIVGGGEELSYVEFAPGSATLDADDIGKLKTLTKLLNERPNLKLDVMGRVDPAADREALQRPPIGEAGTGVSDKDLQRLADARADAARRWLVNEGKLTPSRVFLVAPKLTVEEINDKGKATRVDFRVK